MLWWTAFTFLLILLQSLCMMEFWVEMYIEWRIQGILTLEQVFRMGEMPRKQHRIAFQACQPSRSFDRPKSFQYSEQASGIISEDVHRSIFDRPRNWVVDLGSCDEGSPVNRWSGQSTKEWPWRQRWGKSEKRQTTKLSRFFVKECIGLACLHWINRRLGSVYWGP